MQVPCRNIMCSLEPVAGSLFGNTNRATTALRLAAPRVFWLWYTRHTDYGAGIFGYLRRWTDYFFPECVGRMGWRVPLATLHFRTGGAAAADMLTQNGRLEMDSMPMSRNNRIRQAMQALGRIVDDTAPHWMAELMRTEAMLAAEGSPRACGPSEIPLHQALPIQSPPDPPRERVLEDGLHLQEDSRIGCRTVDALLPGVVGIGGRIYGDDSHSRTQTAGVQLAPSTQDPVIYTNNPRNVAAAISERVVKKYKQPAMTEEDKLRFGAVTSAAMGKSGPRETHIFSKEKIEKVMETILSVGELKSKKWSEERFQQRLEQHHAEAYPPVKFTTKVKLEPMGVDDKGNPKPPRFLIADGDPGQIMALIISVFERLFDKNQAERSIKGKARREALSEVAKHLRPTKAHHMKPSVVGLLRVMEKHGIRVAPLNCEQLWKIPSLNTSLNASSRTSPSPRSGMRHSSHHLGGDHGPALIRASWNILP